MATATSSRSRRTTRSRRRRARSANSSQISASSSTISNAWPRPARDRARSRRSLLGRPVVKVNEFTAIGIGGTSLAGKDRRAGGFARHRHRDRFGQWRQDRALQRHRRRRRHAARALPSTCSASRRSSGSRSWRATRRPAPDRSDACAISRAARSATCRRAPPRRTSARSAPTRRTEDKALAIMNMIVEVDRRAGSRERARVRPGRYRADRQADAAVPLHAGAEAARLRCSAAAS